MEESFFSCKQCPKSCSQYEDSQKTHTGEKPFHCDKCTKTFSVNDSLKKLKRAQAIEKPFPSDQCSKTFSINGNLKIHNKHTGTKLFPCDHCPKSFSEGGSLKMHKRKHRG